jgi:hypothetical protein
MRSFLSLLLLSSISCAFATTTLQGRTTLHKAQYDELTVQGQLSFHDLIAQTSLTVLGESQGQHLFSQYIRLYGITDLTDVVCEELTIHGQASVKDCSAEILTVIGNFVGVSLDITQKTDIHGSASFHKSEIADLTLLTQRSTFHDTKIKGTLLLKKNPSTIILEFHGQSVVEGPIVFESPGEVHLFDQADLVQDIVGGTLIVHS